MPEALAWWSYSDPELTARERERIFARAWQYVGHLGELGDGAGYLAARVGDIPIIVTRDREGQLRAFLNVCRHRGSVIATGADARETLQCPYHAWTYGLDGALKAAPRSGREPGFETEDISLRSASVGTWGPFVFANPDPEAAPLAEVLGELPELVAAAGVDVDRLELHSRAESALAANWKLAAENFLECYHCAVAHPGFSALVENVQRGVATGLIERGRLLPESERLIADFQQRVQAALS